MSRRRCNYFNLFMTIFLFFGIMSVYPRAAFAASPVAQEYFATISKNTILNGNLYASDADSDPLTYILQSAPMNGTLVLNSNGSFTYTPLTGFSGTDSFVFKVTDGVNEDTGTVNLKVGPPTIVINSAPPVLTNSTDATFTFSSSTGVTYECFLDNGPGTPCTSPWTVSVNEGLHSFDVEVTDNNSLMGWGGYFWRVDLTPPNSPIVLTPDNGQATNNATPIISGTAEPGPIAIVLDGVAAGTTTALANGNWTWTPASILTEGEHTVKATATDSAGNVSPDSNLNTFTVDMTPPAAPAILTPSNGQTTNNAVPTISGTAEPGAPVAIVLDGAAAGTTTALGNGSWTWTPASALAEGAHTVKAKATDGAGNVSPDSNLDTFIVDITAPAAPVITAPTNGQTMNNATPTISGTAESGAAVTIVLDGAAAGTTTAGAGGSWTWTPSSALAGGTHTVKATATDRAGNVSPDSNTLAFTVDMTSLVPVITLHGINPMQVEAGSSFTDPGATAKDIVDGDITSKITVTGSVYVNRLGTYTLVYNVSNQAGIPAQTVTRSVYVVDTIVPVITLLGDGTIALTEGDSFVDPGATALDSFNGDLSDKITVTGAVDNQTPGTYTLRYNVQDSSGNAAAELTRTVNVNERTRRHSFAENENADLKQLTVKAGGNELALSPAFAAATTSYKAETSADQAEILAVPSDPNAAVTLKGEALTGAKTVSLDEGVNVFEISVKAKNGTIKNYALTVYRQPAKEQQPVTTEIPASLPCTYTDTEGHWAEPYICEAAAKGIVEGDSPTVFRPDGRVTRVEFAAMLLRTQGIPPGSETDTLPFNDSAEIPSWATGTVSAALERGILEGYPDGTFRPRQTLSRSEMAAMLAKAMKWEQKRTRSSFADDAHIPAWAQGYIQSAVEHGVLMGREGNQFVPDAQTTRAEAVVALLRLWHTFQLT